MLAIAAFVALVAMPATALADSLSWAAPWHGPDNIIDGDSETPVASALNAVSFADATHGWAVGLRVDNPTTGSRYAFFAFTGNGGATWSASTIDGVSAELNGVVALSPTSVWAVGQSGTLLHYNGVSWETKTVTDWPSTKALRAIAFSGSTGWAVGDGYGVAITTDGGATWSTLVAPGTTGALRAVAAVGTGAYAVGDTSGGTGSAIMKYLTTTGSSARSPGTGNALFGIAFSDADHGWAVGANAAFVRTTDGGSTWTSSLDTPIPLRDPLLSANGLRSIAFADANNGVAVGRYQGVWRTSDGGHSWSVEDIIDGGLGDYELRGAAFVPGSADHPIAVARAGTITLTKGSEKARAYRGTWTGRVNTCTLTYTAGTGGTIAGVSPQTVAYGGSGTAVTAVPNTGYHFVAWSDGIATATRTDSNVTANKSVTANFAINTYTLTYTAGSGGTISGTSPQTVNHNGSGITVTAVPSTGYHFVSWSDGVLTAARTDSNVTANKSVTANFAINTYTLTYTAGSGGTISGTSPQTVNHNGSGITVTAVPSTGYHFVSWSDGVLTAARTDSNVTANKSVTANFAVDAPDTRTLAYGAGPGGTITGTSPQTVVLGGSGTVVTAIANTGYHFTSWSDGVLTAARTDANVTVDKSVTANFAINTYTLHYTAGTGGTISGTADQTVPYGGSGTAVTAVPNTGYDFVEWSDGGTDAARTDTNVTANHTISATFSSLPPGILAITPSAGAHGSISPSTPQTVASGADLAFTITPSAGYRVAEVLVDGVSVGAVTSYTFNNVTASHTISATFASNLRATSLSVVANHSSVRRGVRVYFHGVIKPNMRNGTHIGFYVRKSTSSTWRLVSVRHIFGSHHWTYYYHPGSARGSYYIRVKYIGSSTFAACTSKTIKVIWR